MSFLGKIFGAHGSDHSRTHGSHHDSHGARTSPVVGNSFHGVKCLSCQTINSPDARFCQSCGDLMVARRCPQCGTTALAGVKFCPQCGKAIAL